MKKEELQARVESYIKDNVDFKGVINKAIHSGSIDVEGIEDEDCILIRAISHAVIQSIADDLKPLTSEMLKYSSNVQLFL